MGEKLKFERSKAVEAAKEILAHLVTERVVIAGSLRRNKPTVGDIEIVYIPKVETGKDPQDMFAKKVVNLTDESIERMLSLGILNRRNNSLGATTWGEKNKLALHVRTGIPIDLFATTAEAWWNYLVCRTGGQKTNVSIASSAQRRGWAWHPYGSGFTDKEGNWHHAESERHVFEMAGVEYLEPHERE